MAQIASVAAITGTGKAFAVNEQGISRELKAGDVLQKGETIRTVGDVRVELVMDDGRLLAVAPNQVLRLDENVTESDQRPTAQDSAVGAPAATADTVLQALERGTDLSTELEATAAGLGGGGADGGSSFVQLLRIVEGVDPLAYNYTYTAPELPPDLQANPDVLTSTTMVLTADPVVLEGSPGVTYTVTLGDPAVSDMTVTLSNGAVIVIPAGSTTGSVLVPVQGDDVYKDGETLQASVDTVQGGGFLEITVTDQNVITVVNDTIDTTPVTVGVSVVNGDGDVNNVIEGNQLTFRFSVNAAPQSDLILNVTIGGVEQTVKIAAGTLFTDVTVDSRADENYLQGASTVTGTVNSVSLTDNGNFENLSIDRASATATIVDDGDVTTASISTSNVTENDAGVTFNISLSNVPQGTATAQVLVGETTYNVAIDANGKGTLFIPTNDPDAYKDPSTITATVTGVTGGNYETVSVAGATATANITDIVGEGDTTGVIVTTADVNENAAGVTFSFALTNPPQAGYPASLTVQIAGEEGTRTVNLDAAGKGTLTIATNNPDVYNDAQTVMATVTAINGGNFEAISVNGASATANVTDINAIDTTTVTLTGPDVVEEGAPVTYTATLLSAAQGEVTVTLSNGEKIFIADKALTGTVTISTEGFEGAALPTVTILSATGGNFENLVPQGVVNTDIDSIPTVNVVGVDGAIAAVNEGGLEGGNLGGSITSSGTFPIDTGSDTLASLVVSGKDGAVDVTLGGTVVGTNGILVVTNTNGNYSWTYTLTSPTIDGVSDETDNFNVLVTDSDGDTANANLTVAINDDTPLADNDAGGTVTEDGATTVVSGNVLDDDAAGADTPKVFDSWSASDTTAIAALNTYGTLVQGTDGAWSYTLDNSRAATQALGSDFNTTYTLNYTMKDADGDPSSAQLTITVKGAADSASVETAAATGPDATVYEAGLVSGDSESTSGTSFTVSATDGIANIVVGGTTVTADELGALSTTNKVISTGEGTLTLTNYNSTTGAVSYTYTLNATIDNDSKVPATGDAVSAADFTDNVSLVVNGIGGSTDSDTLSIRVVDDVPVAADDAMGTMTEDTAKSIDITVNDTEGADTVDWENTGTSDTVYVSADPTKGTVVYNDDGTFTYTPTAGQVGTDSFKYTIVDADGDSSEATVTLTLAADSKPVAVDESATVDESNLATIGSGLNPEDPSAQYGVTASGNLLSNDTVNTGADKATITSVEGQTAVNGVITVDTATGLLKVYVTDAAANTASAGKTAGYWEYTLQAATTDGSTDSETFNYVLTDGDTSSTSNADLTINILDDVPVAADDAMGTMTEDTAKSIDITVNDTEGADTVDWENTGTSDTVYVSADPTKGTVVYNDDGTFTYTPTAGQVGTDSFKYTIVDADGDSSEATVTLTLAADSKPVAVDESATVDESNLATIGSGLNPEDPSAQYGVTASGNLLSNDTVNTGADKATITSVEGQTAVNGVITVDTATGLLKVYVTDAAANTASAGKTAGYWEYTLQAATTDGSTDSETFNYVLTDGDTSSTSNADLTINILDDVPVAADDAMGTMTEDTAKSIDITVNDTEGADTVDWENTGTSDTVYVSADPTKGTVVYNDDGTFTYTPTAGQVGTDSFKYTIVDADGDSSEATVTLTLAADSKPVAVDESATVDESNLATIGSGLNPEDPSAQYGVTASGNLLSNDTVNTGADKATITSVEGQTAVNGVITVDTATGLLKVYVTDAAANTASAGKTAGYWEYTLQAATTDGSTDSETFNYVLTDGDTSSTSNADLTINILDDVPVAADDAMGTMTEDTAKSIDITVNDTEGADTVDWENTGTSDTVYVSADPTKGTVVYNDDGTFTYTPTAGQVGTDSFKYTIVDADGDSSEATVTLTLAADSKPVAVDESATVDESNLATIGSGLNPEDPSAQYGVTASGNLLSNDTVNTGADKATITSVEGQTAVNGVITVDTATGLLKVYVTDAAANTASAGKTAGYWEYTLQAATTDGSTDSETFNYVLTDGDTSSTSNADLTINILDDVPVAADDAMGTMTEDTAKSIDITVNDTEGADTVDWENTGTSDTVYVSADPTKGTVVYNDDGTFTYTPTAGQVGTDSFKYTIVDADGDSSEATVTLTLAADSKPVAVDESATVDESNLATIGSGLNPEDPSAQYGVTASGNLLSNDTVNTGADKATITSVEGQTAVNGVITVDTATGLLKVYVTDAAANTASAGKTAGYWEYTLQAATTDGSTDSETFNYVLTDGDTSSTSNADLTINILDDVPVAADDAMGTMTEDTAKSIDITVNDTEGADTVDWENTGTSDTVYVSADPTKGTVVYNDDGTFTYTPTAGQVGTDSFKYTIVDADGDSSEATVTLTLAADSKPVAVDESATVDESNLATIGSGLNPEDPSAQYGVTASGNLLSNDTVNTGADKATITSVEGQTAVNGVITVDTATGLLKVYVTDAAANTASAGKTAGYWEYTLQAATTDGSTDSETFNYVLTDGDTSSTSNADLTINILDDVPVAISPDNAYMINKTGQSVTGIKLDLDGNIDNNVGADQTGSLRFNYTFSPNGVDSGYTSNQATVYLYVSSDGKNLIGSTLATGTYGTLSVDTSTLVFTSVLTTYGTSAASDTYSFALNKPIDVPTTFNVNDGGYNFVGGNLPYVYFDDKSGENDVLLTPYVYDADTEKYVPDSTVNTNANEGGVGGNSVGDGELLRVDFVNGLSKTVATIDDPAPTVTGSAGYSDPLNQDHTITGHYYVTGASAKFTGITGGAGPSSILIRAIEDIDATVGNGTTGDPEASDDVKTITSVLISYDGAQKTVLITDVNKTVTVGNVGGLADQTFTVHFNGDGTVTVDGVVNTAQIAVFTANGGYTTVEYQWAGGEDFKIGGFGATTSEAEATTLAFDLALTDADGDTVVMADALHIRLSPENHILETGTTGTNSLSVAADTEGSLVGLGGNDTLTGNTGGDILVGGTGNDTMSGGDGVGVPVSDTFIWSLNDQGTSGTPATDTITDFYLAPVSSGGDVLDLADMLPDGLSNESLESYLNFRPTTTGDLSSNVVVEVMPSGGGAATQMITLEGVSMTELNTYAGGSTEAAIIAKLLDSGNLKTDI